MRHFFFSEIRDSFNLSWSNQHVSTFTFHRSFPAYRYWVIIKIIRENVRKKQSVSWINSFMKSSSCQIFFFFHFFFYNQGISMVFYPTWRSIQMTLVIYSPRRRKFNDTILLFWGEHISVEINCIHIFVSKTVTKAKKDVY